MPTHHRSHVRASRSKSRLVSHCVFCSAKPFLWHKKESSPNTSASEKSINFTQIPDEISTEPLSSSINFAFFSITALADNLKWQPIHRVMWYGDISVYQYRQRRYHLMKGQNVREYEGNQGNQGMSSQRPSERETLSIRIAVISERTYIDRHCASTATSCKSACYLISSQWTQNIAQNKWH